MPDVRALRSALRELRRGERGQSLIEVALALPLLAFTLLGGADMARGYAVQLAVQNGARAAAEAMALDSAPTGLESSARARDEMSRTPGMDVGGTCAPSGSVWTCGAATVTTTFTLVDGATKCTGAATTELVGTSTLAVPCYAKVRVQYTFSTLVPWPGLPRAFHLDRETMYRRYQ